VTSARHYLVSLN